MKKITAIVLSMLMILSFAACGNSGNGAGQPSAGGNPEERQAGEENTDAQETKVLVAYFSATNTTKGVAEHIANGYTECRYLSNRSGRTVYECGP